MRILAILCLMASPTLADTFELDNSLRERAKFKSLGVQNWVTFDPKELTLGQPRPDLEDWQGPQGGTPVAQLLSLIAFAEAGPKHYDAVHLGGKRRPPAAPTRLTVRQIQTWVRNTPRQPHAIGRYQFIPSTFNRLIRQLNIPSGTRFSPALQDRMAAALLEEAGYSKFRSGHLSRTRFMDKLARVWAGLPKRNGRSHYHNYAGNRATITRAFFDREMRRIFNA